MRSLGYTAVAAKRHRRDLIQGAAVLLGFDPGDEILFSFAQKAKIHVGVADGFIRLTGGIRTTQKYRTIRPAFFSQRRQSVRVRSFHRQTGNADDVRIEIFAPFDDLFSR